MTDLFDFKASSSVFGVMGNPVEHSKSPQIHQLFARQFGIDMDYNRIQVDTGGFEQAVSHFAAHGGAGLNITVPFKLEAWRLCNKTGNRMSDRAKLAEAVNTLRFDPDGPIFGDNTDGVGMVRDIENNLGFQIHNSRILVLGAGGAVRGALGPLSHCRPARIVIANRTAAKARALAQKFGDRVSSCGLDRIDGPAFDLIINGTAASLDGKLPDIDVQCLGQRTVVYDMMYAPQPTIFMVWALANGAKLAIDGLGMLVEQAAESFFIWHDRQPDTAPVISALRGV